MLKVGRKRKRKELRKKERKTKSTQTRFQLALLGQPPLRLSMSEDVLLSAQAPEISAADRPDKNMRYDLSEESDSSR